MVRGYIYTTTHKYISYQEKNQLQLSSCIFDAIRTLDNKWGNVRRETRQVEYVPWREQLLVTKSLGRIILYVSRWSLSLSRHHTSFASLSNKKRLVKDVGGGGDRATVALLYSPGHNSLLAFVHAHNKLNPFFSDPTKLDWIPRVCSYIRKRNAFFFLSFFLASTPFCRIARSLFHRFPY